MTYCNCYWLHLYHTTGLLRRVANAHEGDITAVAFSANLSLIGTASTDTTVRLWDYSLLALDAVCVGHRADITALCFLDPLPAIATADCAGHVMIWVTRPCPTAGALLWCMRSSALVRDPASVPAASVKANSAAAVVAAAARSCGTDVLAAATDATEATADAAASTAAARTAASTAAAGTAGTTAADAGTTAGTATEQDRPTKRASATVIILANAVASRSAVNVAAPPKLVPVPVTPTCLAFRCQELGGTSAGSDRSSASSSRSSVSAALKCTLIAGDEGGYIRVWDVTSLLTTRLQLRPVLQPVAAPSKRQMPTGSSSESSSSAQQQQRRKQEQKYLRSGPTDGVTVQRACRLKALLDFSAQLRCGEALTAPRSLGTSSSSDSSMCKAAAVVGNSSSSSNSSSNSGQHKRNSAVGSTSDDVLFAAATAAAGVNVTSSTISNINSGTSSTKSRPASRKGSAEVLKQQQQQQQQQRRASRNIALAASSTTASSAAVTAAGNDSVHDGRRMSRNRRSSAISASSDADTSNAGCVLQYDTAGEDRERDSSYSEAARQEDICSAYAQVLHVSTLLCNTYHKHH
jgi:WD domain, G-beta repeat